MCGLDWEDQIKFKVAPKKYCQDTLTEYVVESYYESGFRKVFFQTDLINPVALEAESIEFTKRPSSEALSREIKAFLMDLGIHWEKRADAEWKKSSIGHLSPKEWVNQFSKITDTGTARGILKSLRVISDGEVRNAFMLPEADEIGRKVAHAYFHDDEPGSSCIAMKNILEHMHPEGNVAALDLTNPEFFQNLKADVLYVYEDGLWSGVEVVKRLKSLSEIEALTKSRTKIVFKYCVTCDAGLAAARHATSNHEPRLFDIQSAMPGYHFSFMQPGTDLHFPELLDKSDASIRAAIDASIQPYLFGLTDIWGDELESAQEVCAEIGAQLIRPYLTRKAEEKAQAQAKQEGAELRLPIPEAKPVSDGDVDKWKLGAMMFGSTIVFQSSIPKPVLPLMWLKGEVTIDGTTVNWEPLFWDARRIAEAAKLP